MKTSTAIAITARMSVFPRSRVMTESSAVSSASDNRAFFTCTAWNWNVDAGVVEGLPEESACAATGVAVSLRRSARNFCSVHGVYCFTGGCFSKRKTSLRAGQNHKIPRRRNVCVFCPPGRARRQLTKLEDSLSGSCPDSPTSTSNARLVYRLRLSRPIEDER